MANLVQVIKKAAIEAVEASKPMCYRYGTVKETKPLMIQIDQKLILSSEFLVVSEHLTDYEVEIESEIENAEKATLTVKKSLKVGDKVILLRQMGGQQYLVYDRVGG